MASANLERYVNVEEFSKRVKKLSKQKGVSTTKALTDSGAGKDLLTNLVSKKQDASIVKIIQLSKYFNVSIDYLLGIENATVNKIINQSNVNSDNSTVNVNSTLFNVDNITQEFLNIFNKLTFKEKVTVMDFVSNLNLKQ